MDTFLTPTEKPRGFGMKLAYFFTKRQLGKVLMPLKVHSARLPIRCATSVASRLNGFGA